MPGPDCDQRLFSHGTDGGGMRYGWRNLKGNDDGLTNDGMKCMAGDFARRLRGWAKTNGISVIDAREGEREDELAKEYLANAAGKAGVFPRQIFSIMGYDVTGASAIRCH